MGGTCAGAPKKYYEPNEGDMSDPMVKASMKSPWFKMADQQKWTVNANDLIDALVPAADGRESHEERSALALIELDAFKNGAHLLGLSGEVIERVNEAIGIVKESVTQRALQALESQAREKLRAQRAQEAASA